MTGLGTNLTVAVVLAAFGAALFAVAAVVQHRVVDQVVGAAPPPGPLVDPGAPRTLRLGALVRHPTWWFGARCAVCGAALHVTALILAPLTLVQPVGVLAVPCAVLLSAPWTGRTPTRAVLLGSLICGLGTAGFVTAGATGLTASPPGSAPGWLPALAAVALIGAVLLIGARARAGWVGFLTAGAAAAAAFGLLSGLVKLAGGLLGSGAAVPGAAAGTIARPPPPPTLVAPVPARFSGRGSHGLPHHLLDQKDSP